MVARDGRYFAKNLKIVIHKTIIEKFNEVKTLEDSLIPGILIETAFRRLFF